MHAGANSLDKRQASPEFCEYEHFGQHSIRPFNVLDSLTLKRENMSLLRSERELTCSTFDHGGKGGRESKKVASKLSVLYKGLLSIITQIF